jgi:Glyoxalase/Bleomycin resistance protein/Dioxygenase superfamily
MLSTDSFQAFATATDAPSAVLASPLAPGNLSRTSLSGSQAMDRQCIASLVPMAHVADVAVATAFYEKLGFEICGSFTPPGEDGPSWASLQSGGAQLMLTRASEPVVAGQQAVLFYVYCGDVGAMHGQLAKAGLAPGPIAKPFYNPQGEFPLVDPDGYVVMVTHI